MRRAELIEAARELNETIAASKLRDALIGYTRKSDTTDTVDEATRLLLAALRSYSIRAHTFNPHTKELAEIFDLEALEDPSYWAQLLASRGKLTLSRVAEKLSFTIRYLPKIIRLVQQKPLRAIKQSDEPNSKYKGKDVLSIIVIEENNRFSSPVRLIEVLQSVTSMYEACAIMLELSPDELSVVACDSGSDKSFDFLGAAKVIECVKELILSLWDRVVFFREKQLSQRIELIAGALPIIDHIGNLERDSKLGREQAEILRRKILDGVGKFIESGAIIPEIEERSHHNVRSLMAPEPKLLVSSPDEVTSEEGVLLENSEIESVEGENTSGEMSLENLNEFERNELLRLVDKARKQHDPSISAEETEQWVDEPSDDSAT